MLPPMKCTALVPNHPEQIFLRNPNILPLSIIQHPQRNIQNAQVIKLIYRESLPPKINYDVESSFQICLQILLKPQFVPNLNRLVAQSRTHFGLLQEPMENFMGV